MFQNSILFTAGQFARLHHLNKRTLHYYDDIGLFSPAYKGKNGYRYYTYQQSAELESIPGAEYVHWGDQGVSEPTHSP